MPYAIEMVDCSDCETNLTALSYSKQLDILNCNNLGVKYNDTATAKTEIFHSSNVIVEGCEYLKQPLGLLFDTCTNGKCIFIVTGVCEQDIPDQKESKG